MQQSNTTHRIKRDVRANTIMGQEAWDMHMKGKKFNKTKRGHGGYKGAFRNVKLSEINLLLSAQ